MLLDEGVGEEYKLRILFFKSGLVLPLCWFCGVCDVGDALSAVLDAEWFSRSDSVGFVFDLLTATGRSKSEDVDEDWASGVVFGGPKSNRDERSLVVLCALLAEDAAAGAANEAGACAEVEVGTFWYLAASLEPSSFHLPSTYFVRTKLSTLLSIGT